MLFFIFWPLPEKLLNCPKKIILPDSGGGAAAPQPPPSSYAYGDSEHPTTVPLWRNCQLMAGSGTLRQRLKRIGTQGNGVPAAPTAGK